MLEDKKDEQLAVLFIAHDERAYYEELYKRYAQKTLRKAITYVRNLEDAEDIVQNVWIKVFFNLKKFKRQSSFSTWVYRITVNESISHLRKRKAFSLEKLTEEEGLQIEDAFADFVKEIENTSVLKDIMSTLSPDVRSLLLLKFGDRYTYEEISKMTGLSESAIKMRLSRARKEIKSRVETLDNKNNNS